VNYSKDRGKNDNGVAVYADIAPEKIK